MKNYLTIFVLLLAFCDYSNAQHSNFTEIHSDKTIKLEAENAPKKAETVVVTSCESVIFLSGFYADSESNFTAKYVENCNTNLKSELQPTVESSPVSAKKSTTTSESSNKNADILTDASSNIKIYPNPSSGFLNIELPEQALNNNASVSISDLSGKLIDVISVNTLQSLKLGLNLKRLNLKNGLYLLDVQYADQLFRHKISIVQ